MADRCRLVASWCTAAGLSLLGVGCAVLTAGGCATAPKSPFAKKAQEPASTAVSGSGNFASNDGMKNPSKVYLAYGQWQEQMGQQAEARESYGKVLADHPKDVEALLGMARLDQAAGLMDDAELRLQKASKISPKDPRVLASYGNFYAAQQNWPRSIDKLQAAVKQAPDDPRYQFLLGVSLARSGDADQAYPYFIRAVGDAQAHFNIGYILYEQGDRAAGEKHFVQALALKPDLAPAQTMLDRIHHKQGDTMLVKGTEDADSPAAGVRTIPLNTQEERVPLQGNETSLPRSTTRRVSNSSLPEPPPGLTPAQLEQWRNQQGQ